MLKIVMDSILKQSYPHIQHCISIGASTDGSLELLKEYESKYAIAGKTLTWTNKPDKCIAEGYNNALRLISDESEYFCMLTNPYISEHSLEIEMNELLKNHYDVLFCGGIMQKDGIIVRKISGGGNPKNWRLGWMNTTESLIMRKSILDKHGYYDEKMFANLWAEDYEYNLRILQDKTLKIGTLKYPIVNFIYGGISSTKLFDMAKHFHIILKSRGVRFAWVTVLFKCIRVACRIIFTVRRPVPPEARIDWQT
jgi:glycosyltransferase involved in cell wall biosynthesis